jgi:hypothetical protein
MIAAWVSRLFTRPSKVLRQERKRGKAARSFQPSAEMLECRALPTFNAATPAFNLASDSTAVAVADFNNDGKADVVTLTSVAGTTNVGLVGLDGTSTTVPVSSLGGPIGVALGNGDNSFSAPTLLTTPASPNQVWVADVNGDGNADILATYPLSSPTSGVTTGLSIFLGRGDGTFQAPVSPNLGNGIVAIATGDFNGDGKLDLFAIGSGAGPFQNTTFDFTYLGNGDGTFGVPTSTIVGGLGAHLAVGDFDGDGRLDVAIADVPTLDAADNLTYTVTTLLGKNDGSFQLPVDQTVYTVPFATQPVAGRDPFITVGDLNQDGKSDVVVTINRDLVAAVGSVPEFPPPLPHSHQPLPSIDTTAPQPGVVRILFGSATGLQSPVSVNPGVGSGATQIVDVNHDGLPDLVVPSNGVDPIDIAPPPDEFIAPDDGGVTVLLNRGNGTFSNPVSYLVPVSGPVVAADFNGDGNIDFLISNNTLLEGNGDGTFQGTASNYVGPGASSMAGNETDAQAIGDFNGDGNLDVAVTDATAGTVQIFLGLGNGAFQDPAVYAVGTDGLSGDGPRGIVAGDFNGDGRLDLALAVEGAPGAVSFLYGSGDGTFQKPVFEGPSVQFPFSIAAADFNGDGIADVVITDPVARTATVFESGPTGRGITLPTTDQPALVVGDFNGDGRPDLATNSVVYLNNGAGGFTPVGTLPLGSGPTESLAVGDFNGDGKLDIAAHIGTPDSPLSGVSPKTAGAINILLGNGDGTFSVPTLAIAAQPLQQIPGGSYAETVASSIVVADVNGDGIADLLVNGENAIQVSLGRGDGGFYTPETVSSTAGIAGQIAVGDFNNDGLPDVAEVDAGANYTKFVEPGFENVLLNAGDVRPSSSGAVGFRISAAATTTENQPFSVTVTAVDASGNPVTNFLGTVYLYNDHGQATPYTFTAVDAGTHVFADAFTESAGGAHTVSAGAPFMTTGSAMVIAAPGSFVVSAPTSTTAGVGMPITVRAVDAMGNPWPGFEGTVTLTSSDAQAKPVTIFLSASDAGVLTIPSTLFTAGIQIVSVSAPNMDTVSATVVVTPASASSFAISGVPASTVAGGQSFTVTARDAFGNVAKSYAGTVTFSSSDLRAGLPTTYAFTPVDAGVHRFTVTFETAGPQSITLADVTEAALTASASTLVTPGAASVIQLDGAVSGAAGLPLDIGISVRDAFGNLATGYSGTLHFASSDPQAILPADASLTNGTGTIFVRMMTPGTQTLSATDVANAALAGTTAIQVTPPVFAGMSVTGIPAAVTAGATQSLTVTALDSTGQTMTGFTGTVLFSSSDVQAGLPASYTFTAGDAGIHTFAVSLRTAGTQSITVTDPSGNPLSIQSGITVTPGAAANLSLRGFPTTTTAGIAQNFTVTAYDAFGNVATGYAGQVALGSSDLQASLTPAGYLFTAADAGVHTFSSILKTAGVQSLSVSSGTLVATQSDIVVNAAAVASLSIAGPPSATAGAAQTVTVSAKDAFGNAVPGYVGTVRFSSSDVQAGLPAAYAFTVADAGSHRFAIVLKTAGTQSITAQDTLQTALLAMQAGIVVTPAAAATFVVAGFPATTAGVAHSFTVTAKDAFGNVTTNYAGTVRFGSSDVQAGLPTLYTFTASDAGTHTFAATLKTAGAESITVQDAMIGIAGSELGIAVSAAAATHFSIGAPTSAATSKSFTVTVIALDAFGNVAVGYRGKVHFTSSDSKASLSSDYTFTAGDNGVHVFTFTLNTIGIQSILINDVTNSTFNGSATVNVSAPAGGGGGGGGGSGGKS